MRFLADGPDMPDELLTARDEGRVVFFCGAGVSRARAGLPNFYELADRSMNLTPRAVPLARAIAPCRYGRRAVTREETSNLEDLAIDLSVATGADRFCATASTTDTPSAGPATRCST